jgi:hypothetical protein
MQKAKNTIDSMAVSATLHCLVGCAIGEITGLIIGTIFGLSMHATFLLAISLAFLFGYTLSMLPLLGAGMTFRAALSVVLIADTLSIAVMEVTDNIVMAIIPGAMNAGLVNPLFWIAMPVSLTAAFFVALPVNKYLLRRNKGHAHTMQHLAAHGHEHHH